MSQLSTTDQQQLREFQAKLTLTDIGVIFSILASVITGAFVFGVLYGQVAENTKFRVEASKELVDQGKDLASIKTSVDYIVKTIDENRQESLERLHK